LRIDRPGQLYKTDDGDNESTLHAFADKRSLVWVLPVIDGLYNSTFNTSVRAERGDLMVPRESSWRSL